MGLKWSLRETVLQQRASETTEKCRVVSCWRLILVYNVVSHLGEHSFLLETLVLCHTCWTCKCFAAYCERFSVLCYFRCRWALCSCVELMTFVWMFGTVCKTSWKEKHSRFPVCALHLFIHQHILSLVFILQCSSLSTDLKTWNNIPGFFCVCIVFREAHSFDNRTMRISVIPTILIGKNTLVLHWK